MRQVSSSYSSLLPCHSLACCILPCHHVHFIYMFFQNLHPRGFFQFFPLSVLSPTTLARARRPSQTLVREREKNILGMDRGLSSGPSLPPGDHRSSFVPFGGRLVLQRLTGHPPCPFECPAKTLVKTSPKPTKLSSML